MFQRVRIEVPLAPSVELPTAPLFLPTFMTSLVKSLLIRPSFLLQSLLDVAPLDIQYRIVLPAVLLVLRIVFEVLFIQSQRLEQVVVRGLQVLTSRPS